MKVVHQVAYAAPADAVQCVEVDELGPATGDQVTVEMEAFPINPADVLALTGDYAARPPLPVIPGAEGVGKVVEAGPGVASLKVGDRVIPLDRGNWVQRKQVNEENVVRIDAAADVLQLAMLKVNPATAHLMLSRYVDLQPGDYVIQNAANSGVGTCVIALAKRLGVRTINVVRRPELRASIEARGADLVLVDGDELASEVREAVGDAPVRLAIDAVAGSSCMRLSKCLSEEGVVVNYGLLSGEPCMINASETVFRSISLQGFWLAKMLMQMPRDQKEALYAELAPLVSDGTLNVPVERTYRIDEIDRAVSHAARSARDGKVLVTPN